MRLKITRKTGAKAILTPFVQPIESPVANRKSQINTARHLHPTLKTPNWLLQIPLRESPDQKSLTRFAVKSSASFARWHSNWKQGSTLSRYLTPFETCSSLACAPTFHEKSVRCRCCIPLAKPLSESAKQNCLSQ